MRAFWMIAVLPLAGCEMGNLGNPIQWPGMVLSSTVENGVYSARRSRVSDHVTANQAEILADIERGSGDALRRAFDLAKVAPNDRPALLGILRKDLAMFRPNTAAARERLVVTLMVHGG